MREIVLSQKEIQEITKGLGEKLTERFKSASSAPVFVGVMKGALNFMMDLIKNVDVPMMTDYIQISSYEGTESTGIIHLKRDLTLDIKGKSVVIVEDIVDTGYSLHYLKEYLLEKYQPKEVIICCFIDKKCARKIDVDVYYVGYTIDKPAFVMGYGLDYNEFARNIDYVYIPPKEEIELYDKLSK